MKIVSMKCMKCGKEFPESLDLYICDVCGLEGILDIVYDYGSISITKEEIERNPDKSLWRYKKMLPLKEDAVVPPLHVGYTPLYRATRIENQHGLKHIYIKDDGRNPTASLKDRASAVGVAKAIEAGANTICAASTGNAASSLAGFAASAGIKTIIFVPKRAPKAKVAQLLVYGAKTVIVDDSYDRAFELSIEITEKFGFYNRNCAYNPYLVEGKKTVAYEMWEQLGFDVPDRVYVSIGDGCITSGIYKGFYDLKELGLTSKIPRIIGVQAAGCNPVEVAMKTGKFVAQTGNTIADSIAVGIPRNRLKAMRALKESKGDCISVTDDEIRSALIELPRSSGVFGEPAGVTAYAGFKKHALTKNVSPDEKVVIVITGNGLKDIDSAISVCSLPAPVMPDTEVVAAHVKTLI
ncbi:MAG: threonine synthase [Candidatus Rifleibacteriota bacterium]